MHFRQAVVRTSAAAHRRRNSGALADEHLGGQQFLVEKQERRKLDQVWQPMVHRGRMDGHFAASNGPFCASIDLRAYCNLWIQASAQHSIANDLFVVAEQISRGRCLTQLRFAPAHDLHAHSTTLSCHQLPLALIGDALWPARTVMRTVAVKHGKGVPELPRKPASARSSAN